MRHPIPILLACLLCAVPVISLGAGDALSNIRNSKSITIAYSPDSLPMSYADQTGSPAGYSVELCRRVVAHLKERLGLDELKTNWIKGNTPERLEAVASGKAHLECGTTTVTLDRQEKVDFSNFVFIETGGILVRNDAGIERLTHLEGRKIAVVADTTTDKRLRKALAVNAVSAQIVPIGEASEGMRLMEKGEVDAFAGDRLVLVGQAGASELRDDLGMVTEEFSFDPYAFALPRGDADFRLEVNRALAALYRSDDIGNIFIKSFGANAVPGDLLKVVYLLYGFAD